MMHRAPHRARTGNDKLKLDQRIVQPDDLTLNDNKETVTTDVHLNAQESRK